MAVYTPVIRLPPKRKPSLIRNHGNNGSNTSNSSHGSPNELSLDPSDCLVSDTLFLSKLPANIRESDIRTLLQHCMPIEIFIDREKDIGQLRFSQAKYADRAYSLYNGFTFTNSTKLELQMYQDKRLDPEAKAALLEINGLPEHFDDNKLYDVFRPFGPLNLCKCVMKDGAFRGTAFVQFFNAYSSNEAVAQMNDYSLDGYRLSVVPFMPSKTHASQQQHQQQHHQHQEEVEYILMIQSRIQSCNPEDPNSVDIMNLYIKNLEPHITNHDLNQTFRKFGRIVSARVMTNPATGQSKGYGFVSFGKSEEAAAALKEMNGVMLGNRPLTVAYHEPRKGRPNTVNYNNNHSNSNSNSNHHHYQQQPQQQQQQQQYQQHDYQPQSYYNSNTNNKLNSSNMERSNNLSSSTPINGLGIDNVDELGMSMNLKDLSIGQKPATLHAATINLPPSRNQQHHPPPRLSPQFSSSPISGASTGRSLASLASGLSIQQPPPMQQQQQHPIVHIGHNGRPTLRRRGSLESVMTESSANLQRIKLEDAVRQCGDYGKATGDIVDMLLTLKRKERSLCLFNPDFLHEKVQLALEALATCNETDSDEEEDEEDDDQDGLEMEYAMRNYKKPTSPSPPTTTASAQPYYTPVQRNVIPSPPIPSARRESKAIPIVAPPPKPTSVTNTSSSSASTSTVVKEEVESMLLSFEGKPIHEKKQLLGDKLFPLVKVKL
ncbi:polyadenylate-binding protein 1 [Mucor ambiguus]|uniref:Polyadenylate-binding protein 1 n=1 Tax=Mucor ambiguus TaxID=91626 RepID=A0A0C9MF31_9FUNG|nr:polyadenylate-binding protein 1 [Mucor ambiguus]